MCNRYRNVIYIDLKDIFLAFKQDMLQFSTTGNFSVTGSNVRKKFVKIRKFAKIRKSHNQNILPSISGSIIGTETCHTAI